MNQERSLRTFTVSNNSQKLKVIPTPNRKIDRGDSRHGLRHSNDIEQATSLLNTATTPGAVLRGAGHRRLWSVVLFMSSSKGDECLSLDLGGGGYTDFHCIILP